MNHIPNSNQMIPISIGQPAPSSFIIRQQQETLQRLQEQNQKQQQQIENLKNRYTSNMPNPISIRSSSPASSINILTNPKSTAITQQATLYDGPNNNSSHYFRSQTPPRQHQPKMESLLFSNNNQIQQNHIQNNPPIIPVTYSNVVPSNSQSSIQISSPQYANTTNRPVYQVQRNLQPEYEQSGQMQDLFPQNLSPHSLRVEQTFIQQQQQIPIIQNPPVIIQSPEVRTNLQYVPTAQHNCQIISGFQHDRSSFHANQEPQTVYLPVETIKQEQIQQPFTITVNRYGNQENGRETSLFPENNSKGFQGSSYRRQMNLSNDFKKQRVEDLNKENDKEYKSSLPDPLRSYQSKSDQYVSRDEHFKMKEKYMHQVDDLELQNTKLHNELKAKNIEIDTQKSINEDLIKKSQKLENRIKELENIIENLKEEQEKIVDVCEKKDVEVEEQNLQLAEKQREANELKQKIENIQEFYTNTQDKLQLYEDTQEELQNQIQKNMNLEQRNNFLNQEIQNSKQIILDLEQQMKQLQGQLPPIPYKQIEQETVQMQQYIQNLEQRLLIIAHEKNEEVQHWRSMAEIDSVRAFQEMENRCKFLATENERLNQIIVGRCIDMRQNW